MTLYNCVTLRWLSIIVAILSLPSLETSPLNNVRDDSQLANSFELFSSSSNGTDLDPSSDNDLRNGGSPRLDQREMTNRTVQDTLMFFRLAPPTNQQRFWGDIPYNKGFRSKRQGPNDHESSNGSLVTEKPIGQDHGANLGASTLNPRDSGMSSGSPLNPSAGSSMKTRSGTEMDNGRYSGTSKRPEETIYDYSSEQLPSRLLDSLQEYQIQINPMVDRINDTAHRVMLDVTVIRKSDSSSFKLPPFRLTDSVLMQPSSNESLKENTNGDVHEDFKNATSPEPLFDDNVLRSASKPEKENTSTKPSFSGSEVTPVPPTIVTSTIQPPVLTSESYFSPRSFYTTTMSTTDLNSTRREFLSTAMTESEATTSMAPGTTAEEATGVDRSENEIDSSDLNNEKVNSSGLDSSLLLGSNEIRGVSVSPYRSSSNVTSSQALGTISTAVPPCRDQSKSNATEVKKEKGDEVTMDGPETPKLESKWMLNGVAYGEEFMKKYGLVKSNGEEGGAAGRNVPFVDKRSSPSELIDALKSLIPQMKDSSNDKSINNNSIVIRESNRPHPQLKPRPQPQPLLMPSTPFNSLPQPQMQRQTQPKPQAERQDPRQSHNQMKPQLQPKPLPQPQVLQIPKPQIPAQANFQPQAKPPIQPELNIPPAKLQTKPHIQLKPAPQIIPKREQNPSPRYEYVNRDSNTNSHLSQPSLPSLPNQPPNQPNQPYMIEEIEHARGPRYAQRSEYNIGPEVFIRIIRHYFANALSPGEIKYTYERIPPKIKPQPLTFPRSPQPAPVIASNQHRAAAAYPNMKSQ